MKTMTCRQLGGACDTKHRGTTADEVIKAQNQHLKQAASDSGHDAARGEMKGRWRHPKASMGWYRSTQQTFADLPEDPRDPS